MTRGKPGNALTYVVPLVLQLICGIGCLGFSSVFHLFSCHSVEVSSCLSRLDYAGIALLIAGSSIPPNYYNFYCEPVQGEYPHATSYSEPNRPSVFSLRVHIPHHHFSVVPRCILRYAEAKI